MSSHPAICVNRKSRKHRSRVFREAAAGIRLAGNGGGFPPGLNAAWLPMSTQLGLGMDLVTVFRAFNPADAQLARSRLEAAGFHAAVLHELSSLSLEGYAMAAGGILVQVLEAEAADARELLAAEPPGNESQ